MSEKQEAIGQLEIFELGQALAKLLNGEKEAIADIKKLHEDHPEMFKNAEEVSRVIKEVVSEPEIIVNAVRKDIDNPNEMILKAAKRLNERKMGDVVIKNDRGVNEIFHANVRRIKEFKRLQKKSLVETPTPSTHQDNLIGELMDKPFGEKTHSATQQSTIVTGGRDAHFLHPDIKSAWAGSKKHSPASNSLPQQSQNVNNNPTQDKPLTKEEFMQQEQQKMVMAKNSKEVEAYSASKDKGKEVSKDKEKSKDKNLEI